MEIYDLDLGIKTLLSSYDLSLIKLYSTTVDASIFGNELLKLNDEFTKQILNITKSEIDEDKVKRIIGKYLKYVKPENNKGTIILTSTNNPAHEIATSDIFKEEK